MRVDVYQMVTDRILEAIENGVCPWRKPWITLQRSEGETPCVNYVTRKSYSPLNCLLLGEPGEYLSAKQIDKLGGRIKPDAEPRMCVFYSQYEFETENENTGEKKMHRIPLLRYYSVYHLSQVDGIESKLGQNAKPSWDGYNHTDEMEDECFSMAQAIVDDYSSFRHVPIEFGGDRACYIPSSDKIRLPKMQAFKNFSEYFSTAFHEMTHSTGHSSRLSRKEVTEPNRFGSEPYGREELTAEIGSAMLCNICGIDNEAAFENSAAYLKSWRDAIKADNKAIVYAACRAEKAVRYILFEYEPNKYQKQ